MEKEIKTIQNAFTRYAELKSIKSDHNKQQNGKTKEYNIFDGSKESVGLLIYDSDQELLGEYLKKLNEVEKEGKENQDIEKIIKKFLKEFDKEEKEVEDIDLTKKEQELNKKMTEFEEMKKFDRDNDGVISVAEQKAYEAYKEAQLKEQLKKEYDINGDGKIDEAEQAAIDAVVKESKKNKDYVDINIAEKEANLKQLKDELEDLKKFDIDKNGKLDKREQAARDTYNGKTEEPEKPEEKEPDFPWKPLLFPKENDKSPKFEPFYYDPEHPELINIEEY